jgi:hypothetical protein
LNVLTQALVADGRMTLGWTKLSLQPPDDTRP